ncbi:MAG: carboxypeptidase-like regulatory domain-containing protein [Flavobacteriales bacterium]|nr:carboxypeptidase-like regulatory domain-containing protein [Flavobacteriales bacterium]
MFSLTLNFATSQETNTDSSYVQFSGIVVTQDSLRPLSYCTVIDKVTKRGTISDFFGYFSFVAKANDTIKFSSIGFKSAEFVIPDTLTTDKYSLIQVMFEDTIVLKTTTIYPWPSKEQFAKAFVETKIPNDDYQRALNNLSRAQLQDRMAFTPMDGALNFKWQQQQIQSKLYYAGQYPPNQLLNPLAWVKFIEAWKRGDFKKK